MPDIRGLVLLALLMFFIPASASVPIRSQLEPDRLALIEGNSLLPIPAPQFYEILGIITKYTPRVEETDSTPTITADGSEVREGIVANNGLKFGTIVEIDGEIYIVADRMNPRYSGNYFDILTFSLKEAREFGKKEMPVKIYY